MDKAIPNRYDWMDSSVINGIEIDFASTFCLSKNSDLQISRISRDGKTCEKHEQPGTHNMKSFHQARDALQLFFVSQRHSFARLNITSDCFEELLRCYKIFNRIWDYVLPFSFKTRESDIGHAPLRFRQSEPVILNPNPRLGSFECAYGFRYVELNNRNVAASENPDYDPWSVRQTTVYQQYDSSLDRVTFLLISPSKRVRRGLETVVQRSKKHVNAFNIHLIILSTLNENWRLYIASLEKLLKNQEDLPTLSEVESESVRSSPLRKCAVEFIDRQRLKKIEDKILDLVIVFESLHNTLSKMKRECERHCLKERCRECICLGIMDEFEEQIYEVEINAKKANVLHKLAQGTAHLLSDLLQYENAQIAHLNEKSLNRLVQESKEENSKMRLLTERSARDAAAVKILTFITIIYLPMTVVLNFFSTQLVHVNDLGELALISHAWWVVVALPLTICTFLVWKIWLAQTMKKHEHAEKPHSIKEKPPEYISTCNGSIRTWKQQAWHFYQSRKNVGDQALQNGNLDRNDLELGYSAGQNRPAISTRSTFDSIGKPHSLESSKQGGNSSGAWSPQNSPNRQVF